VVLAAFMLVSATTQLMWLTYAPIAPDLHALAGLTESQVVALTSIFPLVYIVVSIPVGWIIDRYGFRRATLLGAGLTAVGAGIRVVSPSFGVLLAGSIVIALGQPCVLNSATKLNASWFPGQEAGRANGLFVAALFGGMVVSLGLTPVLFTAFGGVTTGGSLTGVSLVYAALAVAALLFFAAAGAERRPGAVAAMPIGTGSSTVRALLRRPGFVALAAAASIGIGALIAFLQLVGDLLEAKGISETVAGGMSAAFVVAGALGSFGISALADRRARHAEVFAGVLVVTAIGMVAMAVCTRTGLLTLAGLCVTAAIAASWPLSLTLSEELGGREAAGMAASIVLLFGNLAGVVLTSAMEQLHHGRATFGPADLFLAVVCVLGVVPALRPAVRAGRATAPQPDAVA
jgi:MFS family permease